jgi:hypothetical protein
MIRVQCRPFRVLLALCLAATLAGCVSGRSRELREERDARINVYPANYRADILAALHSYLSDPTHIRDAYVSEPSLQPIGRQKRYVTCVRFNARNSDGRYVGSKDVVAVFATGRFDQFIDESTQPGSANQATPTSILNDLFSPADQPNPTTILKDVCGAAEYKPFAELEAMKR